jgi:hypothetical protein
MALAGLLGSASSILGGGLGGSEPPQPTTDISSAAATTTTSSSASTGSMSQGMSPGTLIVLGAILYLIVKGGRHGK